jgi:hypothetical protein
MEGLQRAICVPVIAALAGLAPAHAERTADPADVQPVWDDDDNGLVSRREFEQAVARTDLLDRLEV